MSSHESEWAERLARELFRCAMRHHSDPNLSGPWVQEPGRVAFDLTLCEGDFEPTLYSARVVITVGPR